MCYTGLLKRFVPFLLTFAAGLFIASFFVSLAIPETNWRRNRRCDKSREMQLTIENQNLRQRVAQQDEELRRKVLDQDTDSLLPLVPPVDFEEHHPPPPPSPKRPKHPRFE